MLYPWTGALCSFMPSLLFCIIAKCLQKVIQDEAEGIIIVPIWATQPWFPQLLHILTQDPILLPRSKGLLTQPVSGKLHPLNAKLDLLSCRISGTLSCVQVYQSTLPRLSSHHGEIPLKNNMVHTLEDGYSFAVLGKKFQCKLLQ